MVNEDWGFLAITSNKSYGYPKITSSRPDVVAVKHVDTGDSRGFYLEARGLKSGVSTVTVSYGGVEKSLKVTVEADIYELSIENKATLKTNQVRGFLAMTKDKSLGMPTIKSSAADTVEAKQVNTGDSRGWYFEVKGLKAGVSTVTVNYGGVEKSFEVTVN